MRRQEDTDEKLIYCVDAHVVVIGDLNTQRDIYAVVRLYEDDTLNRREAQLF